MDNSDEDDEPDVAVAIIKPQEWPQPPQFIEPVQPEISKSVEKLSDQMNQIIRKFFFSVQI